MGRSVSYPPDALVAFRDVSDLVDEFEWDDFIDDMRHMALAAWPSMAAEDGWIGREDRILASNAFAHFGVSEYGGLASVWLSPKEPYYTWQSGGWIALRDHWLARVHPKFERTFGELRKLGTFSNGGGVYAPIAGAAPLQDNLGERPGHLVINGLLTDG